MPFLPQNSYDEEQKKLQQNQGGTGTNISGESGTFELPGASQNANAPKPKQGSGSFANLNSYLDANKEQAKTMGTQVAGNVAAKADDAQSSLNNTFESFTNQANQQKVTADQSILDGIQNDPLSITSNAEKLAQAQRMRTANYSGPTSLVDVDGYSDAQSKITQANDQLKSLGTETGRANALQQTYKRPSYSAGQVSLDQALVQKSSDAQNEIASVQSRYGDLLGVLDGKQASAAQTAAAAKAETDKTRNDYAALLGREDDPSTPIDESTGQIGTLRKSLNDKAANFQATNQSLYNNAATQRADQSRQYSADVLALLGLNEGDKLFDTDLSQYSLNYTPTGIDAATVASRDEAARYSALAQLMGQDGTLDTSKAGTAQGVQFDSARLKADLAAKQALNSNYNSELSRNQSELAALLERLGGSDQDLLDLNMVIHGGQYAQQAAGYRNQIANYQNLLNSLRPSEVVRKK